MNLLEKYRQKMSGTKDDPVEALPVDTMDRGKAMVDHMKRLVALDLSRDSSALHAPILEASGKILSAYYREDYAAFVAAASDLEGLYGKCPMDCGGNGQAA